MSEWVAVVDDDLSTLKHVGQILRSGYMKVTSFRSGRSLLEWISAGNRPDLIVLDVLMPEMDGFETLSKLRELESENGISETPVLFLTADTEQNTEIKSLDMGAMDFVRKPVSPDVLISRVRHILANFATIRLLSIKATTDDLTGMLNKNSAGEEITKACRTWPGTLLVMDLDSFKLVNDIYGHDCGDKMLTAFADILKNRVRNDDIVGRIGGDEFAVFLKRTVGEDRVREIVRQLNDQMVAAAFRIIGSRMTIPLGLSAGAVEVPKYGTDFNELFLKADRELHMVKQNGKHGCSFYEGDDSADFTGSFVEDMDMMDLLLNERYIGKGAQWLGQDDFSSVYRYMRRYMHRYNCIAYKVLFTIVFDSSGVADEEYSEIVIHLGNILVTTLRNSDAMMQSAVNQFFLLLPNVDSAHIDIVVNRVMSAWEESGYCEKAQLVYETEEILPVLDNK